jgi:hypothetical protein
MKFLRRTAGYTSADHKRNEEVESRTSLRESKKQKIKLATTCNKKEQPEQRDAKNSAEDQIDEDDLEDFRRDRNRSIKA